MYAHIGQHNVAGGRERLRFSFGGEVKNPQTCQGDKQTGRQTKQPGRCIGKDADVLLSLFPLSSPEPELEQLLGKVCSVCFLCHANKKKRKASSDPPYVRLAAVPLTHSSSDGAGAP